MLAERLGEFEAQHPNLEIEVRIKTAEAEGEILNALSVTSDAAPSTLPDLILLSRSDLELAALLGLLHPFDGLSTSLDDPNWYSYAQQLAHIQNTGYGLPFLGDTLVLIYYPELGQIVTWEDVLASAGHIVFPAGNPQALIGLSLYASAGGEIFGSARLAHARRGGLDPCIDPCARGCLAGCLPGIAGKCDERVPDPADLPDGRGQ
jgi:hypothetical protein